MIYATFIVSLAYSVVIFAVFNITVHSFFIGKRMLLITFHPLCILCFIVSYALIYVTGM